AAQRGHKVILCEKEEELGGALRCERAIPFKQDMVRYINTKALEMKNAGVEVRLGTEVTPDLVESIKPDVLVIAVGAEPIIPPIPGIDGPNVVVANNLSEPEIKIGQRVVILGGGQVGCEAAIHLAQEGRDVTVVEMLPEVAVDANGRHRPILLDMLKKLVTVKTGLKGIRVTEEGLVCEDSSGNEILFPADTIVCAVGQKPRRSVVERLLNTAPRVEEIGDCVKPQRITEATFRGHYAALDI
ncbi:MAG: FAD-dependent oxidoreductase, partial [Oscillospiraceae bacterium]